MKAIIFLLSFIFVSFCVTSGVKTRAVASEKCNIENYQDFINKPGIHNCDLRGANLKNEDFSFDNLKGADLRGAKLPKNTMYGADLAGADLRELDLRGVSLHAVNLTGADLREADLRGVSLQKLKPGLKKVQVWFAPDLREADLRGAKVTRSQADYLRTQGLSGFVVID